MKRYLRYCLLLMLLQALPASAQVEILFYDGDSTEPVFDCWLSDMPTITFGTGGITVMKSSNVEAQMTFTNGMPRIEFKTNTTGELTDIEEELAEELSPATLRFQYLNGQTVVIDGVQGNEHLALYGVDGRAVQADTEQSGSRVTFHLNQLPQGIYIIKVGNQSFKIFKKS